MQKGKPLLTCKTCESQAQATAMASGKVCSHEIKNLVKGSWLVGGEKEASPLVFIPQFVNK